MNYKIVTDRLEIEKMAEDMFLSDDKQITPIDYADLRILKRYGTFKYAIICDTETSNRAWVDEFIKIVESQLPLDGLRAFVMNIIVGDEGMSLFHEDLYDILEFLISMKCTDNETDDSKSKNCIDCLWSISNRQLFPQGMMQIQLMSIYENTEQDKQENEKYEQMIEAYKKSSFPVLNILTPNDSR